MTEDTRKWANANASTPARWASGTTDFRLSQRWERDAQRKEPESEPGVSKEEFFEDLKKASRRQT
jgi:hypothetical protein